MQRSIDYRPLSAPAPRAQVATFTSRAVASGQTPPTTPRVFLGVGIFELVVGVAFLLLEAQSIQNTHESGVGGFFQLGIYWVGAVLFTLLALVGLFVMIPLGIRVRLTMWPNLYRLSVFAAANGFSFEVSENSPDRPFAIFGGGERRVARNVVRADDLEFGNYAYFVATTRNTAKANRRVDWGYVILTVDHELPRMVVTPRTREMLTRAGRVNADRMPGIRVTDPRYYIHAEAGSELAATVALTRPLLEYLMAHELGMETRGNRVVVYQAKRFAFPRRATIESIFEIADVATRGLGAPATS